MCSGLLELHYRWLHLYVQLNSLVTRNFKQLFCYLACECRTEYSSGFSCDVNTGQCKCLKNVSGEKCEQCPYRWIFIEDYGCEPCDNCVHSLLDTTDEIKQLIDPVIKEYGVSNLGLHLLKPCTNLTRFR